VGWVEEKIGKIGRLEDWKGGRMEPRARSQKPKAKKNVE